MKSINNRYEIIDIISSEPSQVEYLVRDHLLENKIKRMKVFDAELSNVEFVKKFETEFVELKNRRHKGLIELYEFAALNTMGDTKVSRKQFFYTYEHLPFEHRIDYLDLDKSEASYVIVELLKVMRFLHFRGIVYKYLSFEHLHIFRKSGRVSVKLSDLAHLNIIDHHYKATHDYNSEFVAPEVNWGEDVDFRSDIYSLGMIFYYLYFKQDYHNRVIDKLGGHNPLNKFVLKATSQILEERHNNLDEFTNELSELIWLGVDKDDIVYYDRIIHNTRIIGRDKIMRDITNIIDEKATKFTHTKAIMLAGEEGSGKSRIIRELSYLLNFGKYNHIILRPKESQGPYHCLNAIIRHILIQDDIPGSVLAKYGAELHALVPDLAAGFEIAMVEKIRLEDDYLRVLNRACNFMIEYCSNRFFAVVIDDLQGLGPYDRLFFEQLLMNSANHGYLLICTANDINALGKEHLRDIHRIKFSYLSTEEISTLIKLTLGINYVPYELVHRLTFATQGKVSLIVQLLNACYNDGVIAFDPDKWDWVFSDEPSDYNIENYPEIQETAYLNLDELTPKQREYCSVLSVLRESFNLGFMFEMLGVDEDEGRDFLLAMETKKILNQKISDVEYVYSFASTGIKNLFYKRMSDDEILKYTKRAADLFKNSYKKYKVANEELIYHLENSQQYEAVCRYADEFAKFFQRNGNFHNSIDMMKISGNASRQLGDMQNYYKTNLNVVKKLLDVGNPMAAMDALEEMGRPVDLSPRNSVYLDILGSKINFTKIKMDEAIVLANQARDQAKEHGFENLYFESLMALKSVYSYLEKSDKVSNILNHVENFATERNNRLYYHIIRSHQMFENRNVSTVNEIISNLEESIDYFERENEIEPLVDILDLMGRVYIYMVGDFNKARECFRRSDIKAHSHGYLSHSVYYARNMGDSYWQEGKNERASDYYEVALLNNQKYSVPDFALMILSSYCYTKIMSSDYGKAYSLLSKIEHEMQTIDARKILVVEYNLMMMEYLATLGNYARAREIRFHFDGGTIKDHYRRLWLKIVDIKIEYATMSSDPEHKISGKTVDQIADLCKDVKNHRDAKIFREFLLAFSLDMIMNDDVVSTHRLRNIDDKIKHLYSSRFVDTTREILDAFVNDFTTERLIKLMNPIAELSKELSWRTYYMLGKLYFKEENFYESIKAYLTAFDLINDLTTSIPGLYRNIYILNDSFKIQLKTNLNRVIRRLSDDSDPTDALSDALILSTDNFFDISRVNELFDKRSFEDMAGIQGSDFTDEILLKNLGKNDHENFRHILARVAHITMAERAYLYFVGEGEEITETISLNDESPTFDIDSLIYNVGNDAGGIFVSKINAKTYTQLLIKNQKGLIYFPIYEEGDAKIGGQRKYDLFAAKKQIVAYIMLETGSVINRFNEDSFAKVKSYSSMFRIFIDNYNLKKHSTIDKLTGVYLRKYFEQQFAGLLQNSRKNSGSFSVIMLDIDKFKVVNDTYGHRKGDEILTKLGGILNRSTRSTDIVARYGGEEFVILLSNTSSENAYQVAEKIRVNVESARLLGEESPLTVSLGISTYPENGSTEEELVEKADRALYYSKENGRNLTTTWDPMILKTVQRYDRLTGIITGQLTSDTRNVQAMLRIINSMDNKTDSVETKRLEVFKTLIDIVQGETIELYTLGEGDDIKEQLMVRRGEHDMFHINEPDNRIIGKFGHTNVSDFMIDWGNRIKPEQTDVIDWKSLIVLSYNNDDRKGLVVIKVPISEKEFDFSDFNFVLSLRPVIERVIFDNEG